MTPRFHSHVLGPYPFALTDPQFMVIAMIQRLWGQSFLRSLAATIVAVGHAEEGSAPGRGG